MVTNKRFVKAWMTSDSVSEVAQKLKMTKLGASQRATQLRAKGVKLPRKNPVHHNFSVDELNQLVEQYN